MSAAFESICESTSHKETISTGDTCTSRNRSDFPYHPQPIKPTRRRLSRSYSCAGARAAAANPKAVVWRNSRRFIGIPAKARLVYSFASIMTDNERGIYFLFVDRTSGSLLGYGDY